LNTVKQKKLKEFEKKHRGKTVELETREMLKKQGCIGT
jgi:hypothetical protein